MSRAIPEFPSAKILFHQSFSRFSRTNHQHFPKSIDAFTKLLKIWRNSRLFSGCSRTFDLGSFGQFRYRPLLGEMLLCPTCYYGSARSDDIDFPTFVMLFDAIFKQGLARPERGIRAILDPLCKKLKELGSRGA